MITEDQKKYYSRFEVYTAEPITDKPLLDKISKGALIAWFRCHSCKSCLWRKEVIENDISLDHDVHFCSRLHRAPNYIEMVSYLGYSKEGREKDTYPKYREENDE